MAKKLFLAIIIAFISAFPLLHKGLPPTHDGEYHIIRFYEFYKTLSDGNIYPRWAPDLNNGFGLPLFNYVYPLPNYVASLLHVINFSFIDAFKLNMFLAVIIGSIFFYLWAKEYWGEWGALVSSVFYSFAPYHLLDIYIRGSVGEVWALAFFPAFLWSVTKFIREDKHSYAIYSSIFLTLIIFSHNILALMFFFFAIFYAFFVSLNFNKKKLKNLILIFISAIGLSAIFWAPALLEKQFVRGLEVYDYSSNFPELYQLLIPSWGSGFSGGLLDNQLSFQIGVANLLAILVGVIILFKSKPNRRIISFFLISFFVVFFLMLGISLPFWKIFPLMNYFQFPWRFLSLEILICSFLAGSVVYLWKGKMLATILILTAILLGIGYEQPAYYHQRDDNYYTSRSNFIDGTNSPGNAFNTIWAGDLKKTKNKIILSAGDISDLNIKNTKYTFNSNSQTDYKIVVNTAYFPGWNAYIDGKKKNIKTAKEGNFYFDVGKGKHFITIQFEETNIRKIADLVSLLSALSILLYISRFARIKR